MPYVFLACAFVLNAAANVLLKIGSQKGITTNVPLTMLFVSNWQILLGIALFAANVLFYFAALRTFPLSLAYPIMVTMSFVLINGYALLFLDEQLQIVQLVGYALLIVGLTLIVGFGR